MEEGIYARENKVTTLLLYRQYNTYQVLLEAYPKNGLTVEECRSKIILYIMNWFQRRLGEEAIQSMPEIQFLKKDYPSADAYKAFDISKVPDINKLSAIDVKTAYTEEDQSWVFELTEPDNGNEQKDIKGRTFITQILVYLKEATVVFGVKTTCKEPAYNTDDADVYRPGFIKAINSDPDIELSEEGIPYEYRFGDIPVLLNGKSSQDCSSIYTQLIANPRRQLPVVFIPESLYEKDEETKQMLNGRTRSHLGFAHVVVVTRSNQKLFRNEMNDLELLEVSSEGQVILYRSNPGRTVTVEPVYFTPKEEMEEAKPEEKITDGESVNEEQSADEGEKLIEEVDGSEELCQSKTNEEDEFEKLDTIVKKLDPLRRNYDFGDYSFTAKLWDPKKIMESLSESYNDSEQIKVISAEQDRLRAELEEKNRDNEELQRRINEFELSRKRIEGLVRSEYKHREVEPAAVLNDGMYFYMVGFIRNIDKEIEFTDPDDAKPTIYRIDRIKNFKTTQEHFKIPYKDRFEEGEFRKRIQFMFGGKLRKEKFIYKGLSIESVEDRFPTAKIEKQKDGEYLVEVKVYGDGIDMWLRSQGEWVELKQ